MKNLLMLILATFFTTSLFSQDLPIPTKWKIKKWGISMGVDQDMINNMDGNYLISTAKNASATLPEGFSFDEEDMYGGTCENPHIRITAALEVPGFRNTELQVGVNAFFNRVDGAYYSEEDRYNSDLGYFESSYLSVDSYNHELGIEGAMVKRYSVGNLMNLYVGAGTNLGYAFGGDLYLSGTDLETVEQNMDRSFTDIVSGNTYDYYDENDHNFEIKNAFHQRVFLQTGIGIIFLKRLEIGLEGRFGYGYKATIDGPIRTTNLKSVGLSTKWILK